MGEPKEEEGSLEDSLQDSVVREALEGGLDLRDYSKWVLQKYELSSLLCCRQIEDELAAAEKASIADYISQSGNIAQLHNQVRWDLQNHPFTLGLFLKTILSLLIGVEL